MPAMFTNKQLLCCVESWIRIQNIMGYVSIADRRTLVSIWSQLIADDRKRSQSIAEDRTWFYLLRSSAIMIADDRSSVFPYDRRRSQNILRSAICDPRSSAIIWKPAFTASNTKHINLIWLPLEITHHIHTLHEYLQPWLLYNLQLQSRTKVLTHLIKTNTFYWHPSIQCNFKKHILCR